MKTNSINTLLDYWTLRPDVREAVIDIIFNAPEMNEHNYADFAREHLGIICGPTASADRRNPSQYNLGLIATMAGRGLWL